MRRFLLRLYNAVSSRRAEHELARELASHLALLEDELRRQGMTADEARLAARRAIGGIEHAKDLHRDARSFGWLEDLTSDARHALRTMRGNPGFTAVAIITLALGIGANTAIFSVINVVLLNPLPFPDADRLVRVIEHIPAVASPNGRPLVAAGVDLDELIELRQRTRPLSHMISYGTDIVTLVGVSGDGSLTGTSVTAGTFPMLGASPLLGRQFLPDEEAADGPKALILGYGAWQRLFGGDPNVLGRVLTFTGSTTFIGGSVARGAGYSVVGVMPPSFQFPDDSTQFWISRPLVRPADGRPRRVIVMARLADGINAEAAVAELSAMFHELRGDGQKPRDRWSRFELVRVQDEITGPLKTPLLILEGAVGFVMLIACANVANLLLARTASRRREISVRLALGAGRGRLVRQMLTETVMLGLMGGVAGTVLAFGGVRAFRALAASMTRFDLRSSAPLPRLDAIGVDVSVFAFAIVISLLAGLVFGLAPAISGAWGEQIDGLREGTVAVRWRFGLRSNRAVQGILVVGEIAIAMLLLVGGGLLMHSFLRLASVRPGYDPTDVLTFQVAVRGDLYSAATLKAYADDFVARLRSVPGVQGAGYARQLPTVALQESMGLRTAPLAAGATTFMLGAPDARFVSSDYLNVMGVRLLDGRGLRPTRRGADVAELVINQALARRDYSGERPIGRVVYVGRNSKPFEIVGIVDDVRQFDLDRAPQPQFFADLGQWTGPNQFPVGPYFVIRTRARLASLIPEIAAVARQLDSQAALYNIATMEQLVSNSMVRPRLYAVLLGGFAGVAVALAAVGIFGVMAYSVTQRTKEIGIRMALGAQWAQVMRLVMGQSLVLIGIGIVLGVAGAAAVTRYLAGMLFGVTPLDPSTFIAVSLLFGGIALVASYLPARRATKVDPLIALRCE